MNTYTCANCGYLVINGEYCIGKKHAEEYEVKEESVPLVMEGRKYTPIKDVTKCSLKRRD